MATGSILGSGEEAVVVLLFVVIAALGILTWVWSKARAASMLERWAARSGLRLLSAEHKTFLKGPFFWTASRHQWVYRISVQYPDGAVRQGWARCGGWFLGLWTESVDVRWDAPDPQHAPGGFPVIPLGQREDPGPRQ
jgi:hypothetical protein